MPEYLAFLTELSTANRTLLVAIVAVLAHLLVRLVRLLTNSFMTAEFSTHWTKTRTIVSLAISTMIFTVYFGAFGFILQEYGVSLTAYLASASILGLAIGFGSQGIVQDVVTGLTVIFSDLFHVGDMAEISGQTGMVTSIGMRFTVLRNPLGAEVFIPNRTITNVIVYPRGYIRCLADIALSSSDETAQRMTEIVKNIVSGTIEQFPGILRAEPEIENVQVTDAGKRFLRVKFRIWPGRGAPIETTFKQDVVQALKGIDDSYADWKVSINYEVQRRTPAPARRRRRT
ncbi:MAG: mechanosensitive ion channel domain-containing protein [Gammaproteobacteria bacterium]